ncbi:MAG: FHA domain-containing protein, partial [Abyssibacter sp.]|uniref:FHA domain-containing protein n=1 Tax=Abyssibacter sp. TaxID=2320200 RepID=UPI00321A89C6
MSKLIVTDGKDVLDTVELTPERITIGRHPDNTLQLNDKAVSGHHAVIVNIMSESFLEDLDSTNGTLVNGRRIAKHPLSNGDVITMGHHTLKYEADVQIDEDALEQTMILRPGELASATGETLGSAAAAAPVATKPQIGVLTLSSGS